MQKLELKPGVVTGQALTELFAYCKRAQCALPAVNVIGSHTANAVLAAAKQTQCPVIVQYSHGGAQCRSTMVASVATSQFVSRTQPCDSEWPI